MIAFIKFIVFTKSFKGDALTSNTLSLLGQRIAQERLRQNLTQLALSQRSGVAYSTLRKIEAKGIGAMGDYADILAALGQLAQLAAWAVAGQFVPQAENVVGNIKQRKRARTTAGEAFTAVRQPTFPSAQLAPSVPSVVFPASTQPLRKSERLGLDFPYDWSNPAISDTALIGAVLGRARFMDVSKIFAHFGMAQVEQVAADLNIDLHAGVLGALMPGIQRGAQLVSHP
jgi:transcriptional regulator with XRE-family HTH domain